MIQKGASRYQKLCTKIIQCSDNNLKPYLPLTLLSTKHLRTNDGAVEALAHLGLARLAGLAVATATIETAKGWCDMSLG
jgi:hypothetical protein